MNEQTNLKYGIRGDLTVLLKGAEYKSPQKEESAITQALSDIFQHTVGRNDRFPGLTKIIRSIQKGFQGGEPVSDLLTQEEIADILVSAGVYQNQGGAILDMENILNLRLHREGGATYVWEERGGKDNQPRYRLRGRFDLGTH